MITQTVPFRQLAVVALLSIGSLSLWGQNPGKGFQRSALRGAANAPAASRGWSIGQQGCFKDCTGPYGVRSKANNAGLGNNKGTTQKSGSLQKKTTRSPTR